jgi:hypothetical protein
MRRAWFPMTLLSSAALLAACNDGSVTLRTSSLPGVGFGSTPQVAAQTYHRRTLASLSVGGFAKTRGGLESLASTSESLLKKAIRTGFPHSTFHFSNRLTTKLLQGVNVVILGVAEADMTGIAPLDAREQANLLHFVKGGGNAVIFADNDLQFQAASDSVLAPFGLSSTGVLSGNQTAAFVNPSNNPVENGPFGTATQLDTGWPAWFSNLGASTELAQLAQNGMPACAYLPAGSLAPGSGTAVFFSDSTMMIDGTRTPNDQTAILNALAL